MKITKKKTVLIVIIIAIIGIVIWMLSNPSKKNEITFDTAIVTKRDISNSVTATGSIEPVTKVEVGTQVSGIIDKLYADYNSTVTKGQLIAEMDKVTLQSELDSKQADYDGSKAECLCYAGISDYFNGGKRGGLYNLDPYIVGRTSGMADSDKERSAYRR